MGRYLSLITLVGLTLNLQGATPAAEYQFRDSGAANAYQIDSAASARSSEWLTAQDSRTKQSVEISRRLVVEAASREALRQLIAGSQLTLVRQVHTNYYILEAPDALTAAREAHRIAAKGKTSVPIMRRNIVPHGPYTVQPNDKYFQAAWHLEQPQGTNAGVDLNVRAAWPYTQGEGVIIAITDDGVEYTHPDLAPRAVGMPHYNFIIGAKDGSPTSTNNIHGTSVAGLALAELNNGQGASGVAPRAGLASWKILTPNASDEQLMDMYEYQNDAVWIQNQSWGWTTGVQQMNGVLEQIGIAQALQTGRGGRGIVMVRSSGNERASGGNANDSGYLTEPGVIVVGAVRADGRVASYSVVGANVLVAAPSGDPTSWPSLFTTDRLGLVGFNHYNWVQDTNLSDYCFSTANSGGGYGGTGFWGTSGSAPQISGIAALVLSANTNLSRRDVQQIILLSSRHFDFADPDMTTNAAGLRVSHNVGFGVPDAAAAVRMALKWPSRPKLTNLTLSASEISSNSPLAIPDDGRRVLIYDGANQIMSVAASPDMGIQLDNTSATLPLVDVGPALAPITQDLTGKAALIKRGTNSFIDKITYAARAGAAFAIIYDNTVESRLVVGSTDFAPIPAVFITLADGGAIHTNLLQTNLQAQLALQAARYHFVVSNTLSCEHVAVRLKLQHPRRSDIRITLTSPQGTQSIVGRVNVDANACTDWTYVSTHHFYECSAGTWTLAVSDESPGSTGSIQAASLTIYGVEMVDTDHDGLDDGWEMQHFGTLAYGPADDPDHDGYSNLREQLMGTNPNVSDSPLKLDIARYDASNFRLSWPSVEQTNYQVLSGAELTTLSVRTNIPGRVTETSILLPATNTSQFYEIRR